MISVRIIFSSIAEITFQIFLWIFTFIYCHFNSVVVQIGYSKIVANQGKYNRRALGRLYATFCDHSVLYLSGLYPLLKKDVYQIRTFYFRYCKFLPYLHPWYSNGKIIRKSDVPNISATPAWKFLGISFLSFIASSFFGPSVRLISL